MIIRIIQGIRKVNLMKNNKFLTLGLIILIGIGVFFLGRGYYYNNIYNYPRIINDSLEKFYVSNETGDLDPIGNVLDRYKNNENKLRDVQSKVYEVLKGWIDFLNTKYICDSSNVNSCRLYYNELINMKSNIRKVYVYRDKIISQEKFSVLNSEIESKTEEVKEIIEDSSSVRGKSYEELRLDKCSKINDCQPCRDVLCNCTYVNNDGTKETVRCRIDTPENN